MNNKETLLAVEGMTCGSCVRHVRDALVELEGVAQVDVRLKDGRVLVRHDSEAAPVEELVKTLSDAGYKANASS